MDIKQENKNTYKFHNPNDTNTILYEIIIKEGLYEFNPKRKKDERKGWQYRNKADFFVNPSLIFAKLFPSCGEDDDKGKYLTLVKEEMEKLNKNGILQSIKERIQSTLPKLKEMKFEFKRIAATISWRMIIGLGASHPQETSMTLHHIYGIPYIPSSAVKGATRHWVIWEKFGNDEKKAEENEDYRRIFGTKENVGEVIFFDAYPVSKINLKLDVMTPHYGDYYSEEKPPSDWLTPNPINFLTVEKTEFMFYLASRDNNLLQKAEEWLNEALQNYGIGAKTAIGYGYFEINL